MKFIYYFLSALDRIIPARPVYAHCDIPCGIYTIEPARTAAKTVIKMIEKLTEADPADIHAITRYTMAKEEHAQKCKEELLILWTDYFKPEHVEMFPELHNTFWKAAKLCSQVKQEVSKEKAQELQEAVENIAGMFEKAHSH
jgi:nickel superoxide dismutase